VAEILVDQQDEPVIPFDNSYAKLPAHFFARQEPTPVSDNARVMRVNRPLAEQLGLDADALAGPIGAEILAGNRVANGSDPLAMAYAGHQFGNWVPQLGDGRAVLLGEVVDRDGARRDIQLKGSGQTPYSRGGDGRAPIGPVIREFLVSEGMYGLGVPTTRSLAMVDSGMPVLRETLEPGGVLTRVASSHIRVGTFQFFRARDDMEGVQALADYVIARHYPEAAGADNPYLALLGCVIERQADLIAKWMLVGFIHGVMNTDNASISGETIDYGPCAFMDAYHPNTLYSSIDSAGRYAYSQQPPIGLWNMTRFAETLLPLFDDDQDRAVDIATEALGAYGPRFEASYFAGLRLKIGLAVEQVGDTELAFDLLSRMSDNSADHTLTFRRLSDLPPDNTDKDGPVRDLFEDPNSFDEWAATWRDALRDDPQDAATRRLAMRAVNPAYIPRNHLIQHAIEQVVREQNEQPIEDLLVVLTRPFDDHPGYERFAEPPKPEEVVTRTFCGT
jgi:uncharacterized protein YdiU (UPF0061 family)